MRKSYIVGICDSRGGCSDYRQNFDRLRRTLPEVPENALATAIFVAKSCIPVEYVG